MLLQRAKLHVQVRDLQTMDCHVSARKQGFAEDHDHSSSGRASVRAVVSLVALWPLLVTPSVRAHSKLLLQYTSTQLSRNAYSPRLACTQCAAAQAIMHTDSGVHYES